MICRSCGKELHPYEKFCGNCGAMIDGSDQGAAGYAESFNSQQNPYVQSQYGQPQYQQPQYQQPQYQQPQYQQPQYGQPYAAPGAVDPVAESLSKSALTFGILSLVFSGILGIIFASIALSKAKTYAASYPLAGRAKVGKILGTIGLIVSIVALVVMIIAFAAGGITALYYL